MSKKQEPDILDDWHVLAPRKTLLLLNGAVATLIFGLVASWVVTAPWAFQYPLPAMIPWAIALALASLMSIVFFIGSWLERH